MLMVREVVCQKCCIFDSSTPLPMKRYAPGWLLTASVLLTTLLPHRIQAQIIESDYQVVLGASINLYKNLSGHAFKNNFPGIKAFVGFSSTNRLFIHERLENNYGLFNFSVNVAIYNKSLGNSLNILYQDNQVDLTSSFSLGIMQHADLPYLKQMQTINNVPFYNLRHNARYAGIISTNFILNSTGRHQTVGAISLTVDQVSVNYYNDGGPLIGKGFGWDRAWYWNVLLSPLLLTADLVSGLGDGFDRWWTGGMGVYYHTDREFNRWEATFDQFTGYHRLVFELGSIFGTDVQDYDLFQAYNPALSEDQSMNLKSDRRFANSFNSSAYSFRYFFDNQFSANIGVIGSLRDHRIERFFALQDIIHVLKRDPLHPNNDINRLFYGVSYYNPIEVR
jgi:hypothetical protein